MKKRKVSPALLAASLLAVLAVAILLLPGLKKRGRGGYVGYLPAPTTAVAAELNSWTQAVQKIKEDRGEPTGKQAKVEIPQELRHYSDTRRFLAVQVAEWREHQFETPHDFVDLARMLKSGEMVELPQVSRNFILFGVGGNADKEPFTRYENGKRIPLYKETELAQAYARAEQSSVILGSEIASLKAQLGVLKKTERTKRVKLQAQINEKEKTVKARQDDKGQLDRYYEDVKKRQQLFTDYSSLETVAKSFSDRTYDIEDARSRQAMKVRMLSSLRPEALKVLEEVASAYREKFDRPLPITSLVRPDEYQYALSKVNPNATRIETPPHSTGLAFDVYYRFMTAEEQSFVMAQLARLKDEGRIEVLRELRDHYHVFAFVDGKRPDEAVISATLNKTKAAKETKDEQSAE